MTTKKRTKRVSTTGEKFNPYEAITDRIIAKLEAGVIPWRKEWNVPISQRALGNAPRNAHSNRPYRGINFAILYGEYSDPRWLTFKDAIDFGGSVRKGEKGTQIAFWKQTSYQRENENGEVETKHGMLLRLYSVFNVEQCDGLKLPERKGEIVPDFNPVDAAEAIVAGMPNAPVIRHGGDRAFYSPASDSVTVPLAGFFSTPDAYYHTLFHELTHSPLHAPRLNRATTDNAGLSCFGSSDYGREELVAELGASFLGSQCGIDAPTLDNAAAYLDNWLKAIKADKKAIFYAAGRAQAAADYILGKKGETA